MEHRVSEIRCYTLSEIRCYTRLQRKSKLTEEDWGERKMGGAICSNLTSHIQPPVKLVFSFFLPAHYLKRKEKQKHRREKD